MYDTGTTAFMVLSTALVVMMTPALALFYGGLSRKKHVVNTMIMSIVAACIVGVVWVLIGDSIAYGNATDAFDENGNLVNMGALFVGGFERIFSNWSVTETLDMNAMVADDQLTGGAIYGSYPSTISIAFQASFAMVTTAIISGSLAGRIKFSAYALIVCLWPILVYAPIAHMVWGGGLIGNEYAIGAIDFAGGTAVHISSGLSGLVLCLILGKRIGMGQLNYRPHNVPFVMLGAGLLLVGWFGFNGGSALIADANAGLAVLNTLVAACAAGVAWVIIEHLVNKKVTLVGACTGIVAGLVVITPACGFVAPWAAVIMGLIVSPVCFVAIAYLKYKLGYDDALDAFGCHGVGGIVGAILTGIFAIPELSFTDFGGLIYTGDPTLLGAQALGVLVTIVYVGIMSAIVGLIAKALCGGTLRVEKEIEQTGLDTTLHGESGYPAFGGLD